MVTESRRLVPIVGTILIGAVVALAGVMVCATGIELLLKFRSNRQRTENDSRPTRSPRFDAIDRAYEPFLAQDLHPQYFFFFPLDAQGKVNVSSAIAHVDADGFRGPGPANARGRRLAFLVGGSAAFGWDASSDATTITGYLNQLQDQYFFVNAAVPSWNSAQEMTRVALQLLDYHPALVIAYDGFNDAVIADDYYRRGFEYPAGTTAHFDALSELHRTNRASERSAARRALESLFPELSKRINARLQAANLASEKPARVPEPPERAIEAHAARYLSNLTRMRDLTVGRGARFIGAFQPVAVLHAHIRAELPFDRFEVVERFHRVVTEKNSFDFEFYDLGSLFDQYYADVPVRDPDITNETIFIDDVHLSDLGNQIVARHLSGLLN